MCADGPGRTGRVCANRHKGATNDTGVDPAGALASAGMTSTSAVLLAEHEPASRELLERHLRDDGFTVFGAAWTARALDLAERVSPDVVIAGETDLCRRLRAGEPGRSWDRNVPVIVLTDPGADAVQAGAATATAGSIVSLHFGHPGTVAALPGILDDLRARGLQAVTASTLLAT